MPLTLPSADRVFPQLPGFRGGGRIATIDQTGIARGAMAAARGEAERDQGLAAAERLNAAAAGQEGQADRLNVDTGRIQGEADQRSIRSAGDVALQTARTEGEIGMQGAKVGGQNAIDQARAIGDVGRAVGESDLKLANAFAGMGTKVASLALEYADKERARQLVDQTITADSSRLKGFSEVKENIENDTSAEGIDKRHVTDADTRLKQAASVISDPREQQNYILKHSPDVEAIGVAARKRGEGLLKDAGLAAANQTLEDNAKIYLSAKTPEERQKVIENTNDVIDSALEKGWISDVQAQKRKADWPQQVAEGKVFTLTAQGRMAALGGFRGQLEASESHGDPTVMNSLGFVGLHQFGAPRLSDLGVYTKGANEDLNGKVWNHTPKNAPGKWTGTFNIPGFEDVKTVDDFRANRDAQLAVYRIHQDKMAEEIHQNGFDKYIGKEVNGVTVTMGGLMGGLHLGGVGGVRSFLNGTGDASDGRTRISDYMRRFANAPDGHDVAQFIPADKAAQLYRQASDESAREARQAEAQVEHNKRTAMETLNLQMSNDVARLQSTGEGDPDLKRENIVALAGETRAQIWEADRNRASKVFSASMRLPTAKSSDIPDIVNTMRPDPKSVGYVEDLDAYKKVQKLAETIQDARTEDPASAVLGMPTVKAAIDAANQSREEKPDGAKVMRPQDAQAVVRASLAAQDALGIINPQALTKAEARELGRQYRTAVQIDGRNDDEKQKAFTQNLYNTYGPDLAPKVMKSIIDHGQLNDQAFKASDDAIEFLMSPMRGQLPSLEQARKADAAARADATAAAIQGKRLPYGGLLEMLGAQDPPAAAGLPAGQEPKAQRPGDKPEPPKFTVQKREGETIGTGSSNVTIAPDAITALHEGRIPDAKFDEIYGRGAAAFFRAKRANDLAKQMPSPPLPAPPEPAESKAAPAKQEKQSQAEPRTKTVKLLKDDNGAILGFEETVA
jgi:hypothetical protein